MTTFKKPVRIVSFALGSSVPLFWLVDQFDDERARLIVTGGIVMFDHYECNFIFLTEWLRVTCRRVHAGDYWATGRIDVLVENSSLNISVASCIPTRLTHVSADSLSLPWRSSQLIADRELLWSEALYSHAEFAV